MLPSSRGTHASRGGKVNQRGTAGWSLCASFRGPIADARKCQLLAGVVRSRTAASWQRSSRRAPVPQRRLQGSPDARFGSVAGIGSPSKRPCTLNTTEWTARQPSRTSCTPSLTDRHDRAIQLAHSEHQASIDPRREPSQRASDADCRWLENYIQTNIIET